MEVSVYWKPAKITGKRRPNDIKEAQWPDIDIAV